VGNEAQLKAAWMTDATTIIDLTADITVTCAGGNPVRSTTASALTLDGHGHTITQTCAGNSVLQSDQTTALIFLNVGITGGTTANSGGGLKSKGPMTVTNSNVHDNTAGTTGGGISAFGALGAVTLTNTTVRNNTSVTGAGGIETGGTAILTDSTVDHNMTTGGGGGIAAVAGVTLVRSTISSNTATAGGGGIGAASVTSTNSTITNNTAGVAGGGGLTTAAATLAYTTIVQNASATGSNLLTRTLNSFATVVALPLGGGVNCVAPSPTSSGFNFSDDSSCGFTLTGQGDRQNAGSPNLGALAGNGGPTQTRLPLTGSPLIDAIPDPSCQTAPLGTGITIDQRSLPRPSPPAGACDIGAVEVQVVTAPLAVAPRFTG
jgi:hypothetical protein